MVKTYLRYRQERSLGVVASPGANIAVNTPGTLAYAPALEDVVVWNIKQGLQVQRYTYANQQGRAHGEDEGAERPVVSRLALSAEDNQYLAGGFTDGSTVVWDTLRESQKVILKGHKNAVSAVAFNQDASLIATGSQDTNIIIWDVIGETGLFRLRGHRDQVTDLCFIPSLSGSDHTGAAASSGYLVSSSKDGFLKVWDLDTQHCIQTVIGHRSEVWTVHYNHRLRRVVTGASDNQLRVWRVYDGSNEGMSSSMASDAVDGDKGIPEQHLELLRPMGSVHRHTSDRAAHIQFREDGKYLAIQGAGKSIEVYRTRSADEVEKKRIRRQRRKKEKRKAKRTHNDMEEQESGIDDDAVTPDKPSKAGDEFELYGIIRSHHKLQSFEFLSDKASSSLSNVAGKSKVTDQAKKGISVLLSTKNNLLEAHCLYQTKAKSEGGPVGFETVKLSSIDNPGHRSDIRCVTLSSDKTLMYSVDASTGKLWNSSTGSCIRTMNTGYGLCCGFGPANKHAMVGTKDGKLKLFDLASGDLIEEHDAHSGAVWSLDVRPDLRGLVTASADKSVKFWDFDLKEVALGESQTATQQLTLTHSRTLKMSDEALCVRYSHNQEADQLLLAVSLLDSTVKVFYEDSLKFFLSLYGHKLPVMDMSISADNTLLVSASADKNVKLWGLDFGDCHKSIFAHEDSLTCVGFIANTHYFFSGAKDGVIKYWDGDRFEKIHSLSGHSGEVWTLSVAKDGTFFVSGGHDRSLRVWRRTEEQVFLDEEREKEVERSLAQEEIDVEQAALDPSFADTAQQGGESKDDPYKAVTLQESGAAARPTTEAAKGAERLMEALQLARDTYKQWEEYKADLKSAEASLSVEERNKRQRLQETGKHVEPLVHPPKVNPFLIGKTPVMYILHTLRSLKPSEFEPSLLMLSFTDALDLLRYLHHLLNQGLAVELCARAVVFLFRLHHSQITANIALTRSMNCLKNMLLFRLRETKDVIGFNYAGLSLLKQMFEEEGKAVRAPDEEPTDKSPEDPGAKTIKYKKRKVQLL